MLTAQRKAIASPARDRMAKVSRVLYQTSTPTLNRNTRISSGPACSQMRSRRLSWSVWRIRTVKRGKKPKRRPMLSGPTLARNAWAMKACVSTARMLITKRLVIAWASSVVTSCSVARSA